MSATDGVVAHEAIVHISARIGAWCARQAGRGRLDGGSDGRLLLQHGPVERVVVLVVERAEENAEELTQVHVVGRLLEAQSATVVEIHGELGGEALAQDLDGRAHLLLADLLVLLLLGGGLEALPGQRAAIEVHAHVAERLHVVASALLDAQVGVDGRVARRARQILVLAVHDVLAGAVVAVLFGEAEVDEEDLIAVAADAHEEVVGLDVAMNEVLVVHELDAADHLVGEHEHGLHGEAARAEVEEILETRTEQIHDEYVVVLLLAVPAYVRYADAALQYLVQLALVQELRVARLHRLELDGDLLAIGHVDAQVDVAERAAADLAYQTVLAAHQEFRLVARVAGRAACLLHLCFFYCYSAAASIGSLLSSALLCS